MTQYHWYFWMARQTYSLLEIVSSVNNNLVSLFAKLLHVLLAFYEGFMLHFIHLLIELLFQ